MGTDVVREHFRAAFRAALSAFRSEMLFFDCSPDPEEGRGTSPERWLREIRSASVIVNEGDVIALRRARQESSVKIAVLRMTDALLQVKSHDRATLKPKSLSVQENPFVRIISSFLENVGSGGTVKWTQLDRPSFLQD